MELSVLRRRHVERRLEMLAERLHRIKAEAERDLGDHQRRIGEHVDGGLRLAAVHEIGKVRARLLFEQAGEITARQPHPFRGGGERDALVEIIGDERDGVGNGGGVLFLGGIGNPFEQRRVFGEDQALMASEGGAEMGEISERIRFLDRCCML